MVNIGVEFYKNGIPLEERKKEETQTPILERARLRSFNRKEKLKGLDHMWILVGDRMVEPFIGREELLPPWLTVWEWP